MLMVSLIYLWYEVLRISNQALHLISSKDQSNKRTLLHFIKYIRGLSTLFLVIPPEQS